MPLDVPYDKLRQMLDGSLHAVFCAVLHAVPCGRWHDNAWPRVLKSKHILCVCVAASSFPCGFVVRLHSVGVAIRQPLG